VIAVDRARPNGTLINVWARLPDVLLSGAAGHRSEARTRIETVLRSGRVSS
jgi:hypothetical protein